MSAKMGNVDNQAEKGRVVSVSVPPSRRVEFDQALAILKRQHKDPFIQVAPLIVETIIEAAERVQTEKQGFSCEEGWSDGEARF